ncbi:MAG: hypothetical protein QNJ97_21805 [Myxococcota bacterium]|nr:hypothetical protein [Myxococcota bacterium]
MIRLHFQSLGVLERTRFCTTVIDVLNDMWDLGLDRQRYEASTYESFICDIAKRAGRAVDRESNAHGKGETYDFLCALSSDRNAPIKSHIHDLAQILFLDREQREEYVNHADIAPPYKISKLLLEYAVKSRQLDQILGVLTKGYCAIQCDRLPVGCCSVLGYDMGLVPQAMLDLQAREANKAGVCLPAQETKCRYHTSEGCAIRLFKSPACIGFLCEELHTFLEKQYPPAALTRFIHPLTVFRNCYLDRKQIFDTMDLAIDTGVQLIETGG